MVQSLWSILAVRQRLPRYQMVANGSVACPHHRSVMFLINNATGRLPSDRINELAGNGTLTVINAGAHYSKAKGSSGLSDFTNDLRTAASALAAMPSRELSLTPSPSAHCTRARRNRLLAHSLEQKLSPSQFNCHRVGPRTCEGVNGSAACVRRS